MKEIMSIKEFSEATGLKVWVVRRLVKEKKLVFFMSGRVAYINYPKSKEFLWGK